MDESIMGNESGLRRGDESVRNPARPVMTTIKLWWRLRLSSSAKPSWQNVRGTSFIRELQSADHNAGLFCVQDMELACFSCRPRSLPRT